MLVSISRPQVTAALKAAGVQWRSTRKDSPVDRDHLRAMVANGTATPTTLARRYGVARNTAARWLADAGLLGADPAIDEQQLRVLYLEQQLTTREVAAGIAARPREVKRTRATREKP